MSQPVSPQSNLLPMGANFATGLLFALPIYAKEGWTDRGITRIACAYTAGICVSDIVQAIAKETGMDSLVQTIAATEASILTIAAAICTSVALHTLAPQLTLKAVIVLSGIAASGMFLAEHMRKPDGKEVLRAIASAALFTLGLKTIKAAAEAKCT